MVKKELGYDPVVITGLSEFELAKGGILNKEEALKEALDDEVFTSMRKNIADVHRSLEEILYNTDLAMSRHQSPEKIAAINNRIVEVKKAVLNLGSAISDSQTETKAPEEETAEAADKNAQ